MSGVQYNHVHDGSTGFSLNVSIPSVLGPRNAVYNQTGSIYCVREGEYVIVGTTGRNDERGAAPGWLMAFSLEGGREGTRLWESTFTPPFASQAGNVSVRMTGVYPEDGVILFESTKLLKRWGYDMKTGELLWESEPELPLSYYGMSDCVYEGKLYSYGYSGQIRAYNITTGNILWNYNATTVGFESPYGGNYPIDVFAIADGKLYTVASEHSPTQPLWRGPNLRCIDAETGEEVWSTLFWGENMGPGQPNAYMADDILVGLNYFDMQLYAFGKGPSATTVSAPQTVPTVGSSVMITGTVTDQTATGSRNINNELDLALKGTPAISDEDMSAWMEYLFMDQARPADAKGVEVVLETLDPNGNFYEIGRTTSDVNGNYGLMWEPPVPGEYKIFATFAGSASYGPSQATTYISVAEAPAATPAPTPTPAPMTDTYVLGIGAAAIIAIVAIGLVIILMLRKR
jgi:outer membrane protein assembly factor BamB